MTNSNRRIQLVLIGVFAALCSLCGCKKKNETTGVTAVASFYKGVSSVARSASMKSGASSAPAPGSARLENNTRSIAAGRWYLSPDTVKLTVTAISFTSEGSSGSLSTNVNCSVTYDRSSPSLAKLVDCPFTVSAGTYTGIGMQISDDVEFTISDSTNHIYSDPSAPFLLSSALPAGGAQAVTLSSCATCPAGSTTTWSTNLLTPLTVSADSPPTVNVVFDPVHWINVRVNGSDFDEKPSTAAIPFIPSVTTLSGVEYYSNAGTLGNFNDVSFTNPPATGIKVYYSSATAPVRLDIIYGLPASNDHLGADSGCVQNMGSSAWAYSHKNAPAGGGGQPADIYFGSGGYLGLDSNSVLGWAAPTDFSYQTWAALFTLTRASSLSQTSTLSYQCTTSVPDPSSGDTYASGAPSFTPSATRTLTLLGH